MLPHQFRRLCDLLRSSTESLRSQLSEIKETANKQESAIRDASQSANVKIGEIPGIIASSIETANKDVPVYEKSQRDKEYEQGQRMLCAAWITGIATVLAFAAASIYACIAKGQLDQMIEATKQTKRSADIAACAMRENQRQFNDTLEQMKAQTNSQGVAAEAAISASNTAARQLEVAQRPWVTIKNSGSPGNLAFDKDGNANITFHFVLSNSGQSPAVNVSINPKLMVIMPGGEKSLPVQMAEVNRFCEAFMKPFYLQEVIFPNTDRVRDVGVGATSAEISQRWLPQFNFVQFKVMICIPYQSGFDTKKWYYTGGIYDLQHDLPGGKKCGIGGGFEVNKDVEAKDISLCTGVYPEIAK
jgi:hypothetical protein